MSNDSIGCSALNDNDRGGVPSRARHEFATDREYVDYLCAEYTVPTPPAVDRDERRFDTFERARAALLRHDYEVPLSFQQLFLQPRIEQRTEAWFMAREQAITSSDFAAALGLNPWQSVAKLLEKKVTGTHEFKGNAATRYGVENEDRALYRYEQDTGNVTFDFGLMSDVRLFAGMPYQWRTSLEKKILWFRSVHIDTSKRDLTWLKGSPDGVALRRNDEKRCYEPVLVEIKCPMRTFKRQSITSYYYPQVQLLMHIMDIEETHFVQYNPPDMVCAEKYDLLVVHRDRQWMQLAIEKARHVFDAIEQCRLNAKAMGIEAIDANHLLVERGKKCVKEGDDKIDDQEKSERERQLRLFPACVKFPDKQGKKKLQPLTERQIRYLEYHKE